jgi:hypothetical protein
MASKIEHIFINDACQGVYFTTVVFPEKKTAVSFPADPNNRMLNSICARDRFDKLLGQFESSGIPVKAPEWQYYEVSPYPDRMSIFLFRIVVKKKLLSTNEGWTIESAEQSDIDQLDAIAQGAGLPTLGEYYREVQDDREANKSFENAAHQMVSSWTHLKPTKVLLAQLRSDLENKYSQVLYYKHGWHYIVIVDGKDTYYRCQNTEMMLRSFILHAEEAFRAGQQIRFAYCLPEYMPEGIEWAAAPAQN